LLKSRRPTGGDGLGNPSHDVQLLILQDSKIVYDYAHARPKQPGYSGVRYYMDDYLEIRDVTNDGTQAVLFHSGYDGVSDSATLEHIILYDESKGSFADTAPDAFYNSGTHGFRWLLAANSTLAVVAERHWSSAIPLEDRCHYCSSRFNYDVYEWSASKHAFARLRRVGGKKSYGEAAEALDGEWDFVRSNLNR
jgi:hypothetical protein